MSSFIVKKAEATDFVEPKTGLTVGVLKEIIDVGTSTKTFEGQSRQVREIMLVFALPKQTFQKEEGAPAEMLTISQWFTLSLHPKGKLKPFLEGITGQAIKDDFDLASILGINCMLNIMEYEKSDGSKSVRIASTSPLMEGLEPVVLTEDECKVFSFDNWDAAVFATLSDRMQERLKQTPEFKAIAENPYID